MNRLAVWGSWGAELAILVLLLWKQTELYEPPVFLILLSPFFLFAHWRLLREEHLSPGLRRRLCFLTFPCMLLSASLVLGHGFMLSKIAHLGGAPKELALAAGQEGMIRDCWDQWFRDARARMNSEILLDAALLASLCLLYGSRSSTAKQGTATLKGDPLLQ